MKGLVEQATMVAIADAIRAKTQSSELLLPSQMPAAIEGIVAGGGGSIGDYQAAIIKNTYAATSLNLSPYISSWEQVVMLQIPFNTSSTSATSPTYPLLMMTFIPSILDIGVEVDDKIWHMSLSTTDYSQISGYPQGMYVPSSSQGITRYMITGSLGTYFYGVNHKPDSMVMNVQKRQVRNIDDGAEITRDKLVFQSYDSATNLYIGKNAPVTLLYKEG